MSDPQPIHITDKLVLLVDLEHEAYRANLMRPLLLAHGYIMKAIPFDDRYPRLDPYDRCYDNAVQVAKTCGLVYCEGLLLMQTRKGLMGIAHGWCCDQKGVVIDPTCHSYQHIPEVRHYGIKFNQAYVDWWYKETGYHGLLDGHVDGLPIGVYHDDPGKYLVR